jgi:hypothetical protein
VGELISMKVFALAEIVLSFFKKEISLIQDELELFPESFARIL